MGSRYKVRDPEGIYFITYRVIGWVDLFIRVPYRDCLISSFNHCVKQKGLIVHAYVIMTNHVHMIVSAKDGCSLSKIIGDMKKHTAKKLIALIKELPESRRVWILNKFRYEANRTQRGTRYILWKEGYHAKQLVSNRIMMQKLNYIHRNPVVAGFVSKPEDFLYSSARNYCGELGVMDVELLE